MYDATFGLTELCTKKPIIRDNFSFPSGNLHIHSPILCSSHSDITFKSSLAALYKILAIYPIIMLLPNGHGLELKVRSCAQTVTAMPWTKRTFHSASRSRRLKAKNFCFSNPCLVLANRFSNLFLSFRSSPGLLQDDMTQPRIASLPVIKSQCIAQRPDRAPIERHL
jgi:hypothetical protein